MEKRVSSGLKLHVRSHDLGRVFRLIKGLSFLLIPCRFVLAPSKRRFFQSAPSSSYTESSSLNNGLTNDLLFLVFLVSNFLLFVFGCLCTLIGLFLLYYKLMAPFVISQDYIPLGTFAVLAGVGIIGFSSLGFLTVITVDIKPVLQIYTVVAVFILAIEMSFISLLPRNDMHMTGITPAFFKDFMRSYRHTNDRSHHSMVTNTVLDIVQTQLSCCGLTGPRDWALHNYHYLHGGHLPQSCQCASGSDVKCQQVIIPYNSKHVHVYRPTNDTAWSNGCRKYLLDFENFVKTYIKPGFIVFQVVLLFISTYLLFSQRRTNL